MRWLFHSASNDIMLLYFPALFTLILTPLLPPQSTAMALVALITVYGIDTGHAYVTGWRALKGPDRPRALVVMAFVLGISSLWLLAGGRGFWPLLVYFTFYHHLKQQLGITAWYERLNGRVDRVARRFSAALVAIPFLALHTRPGMQAFWIYTPQDLWWWPSLRLNEGLRMANVIVFAVWFLYEVRTSRQLDRWEWNRIFSILVPAVVSTVCFHFGHNLAEVVFPLLVLHGLTYFAVMSKSVHRLHVSKISLKLAVTAIAVTAALAGAWEFWLGDAAALPEDLSQLNPAQALAAALLVSPTLWHYLVDGWIWKSNHPEAARIYTQLPAGKT